MEVKGLACKIFMTGDYNSFFFSSFFASHFFLLLIYPAVWLWDLLIYDSRCTSHLGFRGSAERGEGGTPESPSATDGGRFVGR